MTRSNRRRRVAPRFPALSAPGPLAIAHRGGSWEAAENTAGSFARAYRLGFRYFETDVRATSDNVALAFHDAHLHRLTGDELLIRHATWETVQRARIHGTAELLRLDELIDAYPDVVFNIDIKEEAAIGPLVDVIRRTGARNRVVIASFSHKRLQAVRHALGPWLATSLSPREVAGMRLAADGRTDRWLPRWAACAQVPETFNGRVIVDGPFVQLAHDIGLQVHVWTVDDPNSMERLLSLDVDGIMTDRPTVLRDTFRRLGIWRGPIETAPEPRKVQAP